MNKIRVGVIGATGMVGQRFVCLLENHPYFEIKILAASKKSAGKKYMDVMENRWKLDEDIPLYVRDIEIKDIYDIDEIKKEVDMVFCAVDMAKDEIKIIEENYAKHDIVVVSNNSANRWTSDVPMIIPEINSNHLDIIEAQRKRLGTKKGFIVTKPNCSIQSYAPILGAIKDLEPYEVVVTTYQAISGAGEDFESWPEMLGNIIPYIDGEEEKSEKEPLKIFGNITNNRIENYDGLIISSQCIRVPVLNGHTAAVFVKCKKKCDLDRIINSINNFSGEPQKYKLPLAPKQFIHYINDNDRPQIKYDVDTEKGMAISVGRIRQDSIYDFKFIGLSHNTIRGAAGGAVLIAELLYAKGLL